MKQLFQTACVGLLFTAAYADQAQMNQTLAQVVTQLQQLKPLIAEAEQEKPAGMNIHFTAFMGADGHIHNGVMEDLNALQEGISQIINAENIDLRYYPPISGDYLEPHHGS